MCFDTVKFKNKQTFFWGSVKNIKLHEPEHCITLCLAIRYYK